MGDNKMANELNTCVFCGGKFTGPGNSTWGYWEVANGLTREEAEKMSEKFRCCDDCNLKYVIPARLKLMRSNNG